MAKKSRRARAKHRAGSMLPQRGPSAGGQMPKTMVKPKASVSSVDLSVSATQAARYQYVLLELRRIGIIAGALLLILIVLAFILG